MAKNEKDAKDQEPNKSSLSLFVYERMLDKFMRNELVPGNILNRREIAQEFGVSVAPVLEALLQLEMEGFVESIPRKGTLVKPVRQEDIFGQLMLREAVECQAAYLYHGGPVRAAKSQLEPIAERLEGTPSDSPEHWEQEIAFHRALISLAGCPALVREYDRFMRLEVFHLVNRILPPTDRAERLSHFDLIEKLSVEDALEAQRSIREHLRSGKQHLFK